jgi:hypothetical protein
MKWEDCVPFAEFSYNNNFQVSLGMAPFEVMAASAALRSIGLIPENVNILVWTSFKM